MCMHTHFLASSPELSPYSIWQGSSHKPFLFCVCAAALWFVNSNFEKKINCANDANPAAALPAFCNFPITLSCMPCVRGGYASTLLQNTGKSVNYFAP